MGGVPSPLLTQGINRQILTFPSLCNKNKTNDSTENWNFKITYQSSKPTPKNYLD